MAGCYICPSARSSVCLETPFRNCFLFWDETQANNLKTWNETETENLKIKTKQNDDNGLKTSSKKPVAKREWEWSEVRAGCSTVVGPNFFIFGWNGVEWSGVFCVVFSLLWSRDTQKRHRTKMRGFFCEYDKVVAVSVVVAIVFVVVHFWLVVKIL